MPDGYWGSSPFYKTVSLIFLYTFEQDQTTDEKPLYLPISHRLLDNNKAMMMSAIKPNLSAIPETMLWTLHNRAYEALRDDGILDDPKCLEIYKSIDYNYDRSFGKADGSHGVRSWLFDNKIREYLAVYPDGVIVNLGEGLETQRFRIATEKVLWLSIDLAEAIAIRERFIHPDAQHLHIGVSALDTAWFDVVPAGKPVFISAQGLFMYFTKEQVSTLVKAIADRLPGAWLMFDYIPCGLSKKH